MRTIGVAVPVARSSSIGVTLKCTWRTTTTTTKNERILVEVRRPTIAWENFEGASAQGMVEATLSTLVQSPLVPVVVVMLSLIGRHEKVMKRKRLQHTAIRQLRVVVMMVVLLASQH